MAVPPFIALRFNLLRDTALKLSRDYLWHQHSPYVHDLIMYLPLSTLYLSLTGIVGVQFTDRLEAGFSVMRTFLATGFLIGFFTARSEICTTYQLWGYFAMIILALSSYTLLSLLTKKKHELLPCCIKKTQTEEVKEMTEKDKQPTKAEENGTNEVQTRL